MFGTSIHWTTFFYLLIDTFIVVFAFFHSKNNRQNNLNRYLILGLLFIFYNLTGGFLPIKNFPGPFILQYVITYGVALIMGIYLFYYIYKEYDIEFLNSHLTISNISIYGTLCFFGLYLFPYYLTNSIDIARLSFTIPVSLISLYFLYSFYKKISTSEKNNQSALRRNKLSLLSVACIALLPVLTVIGDYQWLTFTVVNISFFAITIIEVDRFLFFLEHKKEIAGVFKFYKVNKFDSKFLKKNLTRRELEIAMSILDSKSYKEIGEDFFIAESTVSKHASNIFKKTSTKNRIEFTTRFKLQEK
ncbi:LuxR C-terminal-related transcriptional regulator [Maribacter sp. 2308TA10-17]|uniref:LuxR C-terminal-related transcriptional regulator n=1 Tax=Maribacter sp. 2308TA10-17 TaxID=3386276 RepID=UPI0039BC7660